MKCINYYGDFSGWQGMSGGNQNPVGQWKPGQSGNVAGVNGHVVGWQPFGRRAKFLMQKYSAREVVEIVRDPIRYGNLSSWDAIIMTNIANAIIGDNVLYERIFLVERIEGKSVPTTVKPDDPDQKPTLDEVDNMDYQEVAREFKGFTK